MKSVVLSIFLSVFGGCFALHAQELQKAAIAVGCRIVDEKDFDFNRTGTDELFEWKKEEFRAQSQNTFAANCRAKDGLRYTFWFEEETYADEADAEQRLSRTRALPPQLKKEFEECDGKTLSEYLFRDEFRRGNKVYIISAKPFKLALEDALSPLRKKIESKIK